MEDLRSEVVRLRREVREFRHERDSRRSVDSRSDSRGVEEETSLLHHLLI